MELKRFVRVLARDGDRRRGGTGYLIDGERVLTARHVVEEAGSISVLYDQPTGGGVQTAPTEVAWQGEGDLDVAVLRVSTGLRLGRLLLQPVTWEGGDRPYRSRGWAIAGGEPPPAEPSVLPGFTELAGTAFEFVAEAASFGCSVEAPPNGAEWWKGASGAPVFCERNLVGVIDSARDAFRGGRLTAVPVTALWQSPGFREAVGADATREEILEERRQDLRRHVEEILRGSPEAALALAAERPDWKTLLQTEGSAALAAAICASASWAEVLDAIDGAHEKLGRRAEHAAAADGLFQLLHRLLPELYAAEALVALPEAPGGYLVSFPVETETFAEIAMAAFDGRPLAFQEADTPQRFPAGTALLRPPDPDQEHGYDFTSEEGFRQWLLRLADWLDLEPSHQRAASEPHRVRELARIVDHQIEREATRYRMPRRYFAYPHGFATAHQPFLARVRESLPALHLVELAGESLDEERRALDPLQMILYRAFRARRSKK